MVYQVKLLVVVLGLAWIVFSVARLAFSDVINARQMAHYRNVFFAVTLAAFLSPSGVIYFAALIIIVATSRRRMSEVDPAAHLVGLWMLLVMAVPSVSVSLQGFGGINRFIELNHLRVLAVVVLVPAWMLAKRRPDCPRVGSNVADWAVLGYVLLQLLLNYQQSTFTNVLRIALGLVLDVLIPYFALSRCFTSWAIVNRGVILFICCGLVLCCVGSVEAVRGWPIYQGVESAWGVNWTLSQYLMRSGFFRAQVTGGHSLVFGLMCLLIIGFWTYVQQFVKGHTWKMLGHFAVGAGMLASLARGSWVAAGVLLTLVSLLGTSPQKNVSRVMGVLFLLLVFSPFIPGFDKLLELLPFVGTDETRNVDYRRDLFDTSMSLIRQSPWLGVPNYLNYMEHLRQGQGIIDLVNSYLGIALNFGVIGLTLYMIPFIYALFALRRARARCVRGDDKFRMCGALIGTTVACLVVIATTSSISVIPTMLTLLVGLSMCVARLQLETSEGGVQVEAQTMVHPRDRAIVQAWQPR